MGTAKTTVTNASVADFINSVSDDAKKKDSFTLLKLFAKITGEEPKMWGSSIVGFGSYHYKYASGQEGDWPIAGFSPRKQSLTLYIMPGFENYSDLLTGLGKYKTSKSCLYINKLADVDVGVLEKLLRQSVADTKKQYS